MCSVTGPYQGDESVSMILWYVNATSAAVSGDPSWKRTPSRTLKVTVVETEVTGLLLIIVSLPMYGAGMPMFGLAIGTPPVAISSAMSRKRTPDSGASRHKPRKIKFNTSAGPRSSPSRGRASPDYENRRW